MLAYLNSQTVCNNNVVLVIEIVVKGKQKISITKLNQFDVSLFYLKK